MTKQKKEPKRIEGKTKKEAKAAYEIQARLFAERQVKIMRIWDSAPNPFLAVKAYFTDEARAARARDLVPYFKAKHLNDLFGPEPKESDEDAT